MTKVKDILSIHLEDDITSVVDISTRDEKEDAKIAELNEFILTESLARHLMEFCDFYVSGTKQPGIWLSGFYGSGKSFFAKVAGYLLENPTWKGTPVSERFMPKLEGLKDASLLQNDINEVAKLHNRVIRFDVSKFNNAHGISFMMMENFLRSLGFLGNKYGLWEYEMFIDGKYDAFCKAVEENTGKPWNEVKTMRSESSKAFRAAQLKLGYSEFDYEQTLTDFSDHINHYDATKLGEDLGKYLAIHQDEHLVFFLDEVSEAINQDRIRIDELEGMAEELYHFGNKVWTIAIAQQRLEDVINAKNVNINSITKVIDRFKNRININAEEIDTIIRRRLLAKNDEGNRLLTKYFNDNSGAMIEVTNVGGGLHPTEKAANFADYYPFFGYQFRLLQTFLFGSSNLASTQGGTRGMLISAFDVLQKESMKDRELYNTVNSVQLCRQAEENIDAALNDRYNQAKDIIDQQHMSHVDGRDLLTAIHFLSKTSVKTTPENITKAYISNIDEYYDVLAEVKKALPILVDNRVLIFAGGQYNITSQAQQDILNKKRKIEDSVSAYQVRAGINKVLQQKPFIKALQAINAGDQKIDYYVGIRDGEAFANSGVKSLRVLLSSLLLVDEAGQNDYIEKIKDETQAEKGELNIIPSRSYNDDIYAISRELIALDGLQADMANYDAEQKSAVNALVGTIDEKQAQLQELIGKAYTEGVAVYCYGTSKLSADRFAKTTADLQQKMYDNIFYRRLSGTLPDSIAPKVFHTNANQLCKLFGKNPDFQFFDTSGKFIGENLSVVSEINALTKQYVTGTDLEQHLQEPPTGYSFGTVISTVAAMFRGDKLIVKFNGDDYHSWNSDGAEDIFSNSRNFGKASFKAVTKGLSYNERRDIVDILKDDCRYKHFTHEDISYQMNDFDLVECIRNLAWVMRDKVNNKILGDDEMERLFQTSVKAFDFLKDYVSKVTDTNYLQTARLFLDDANNDDFIKAVERIDKDVYFIDNSLSVIRDQHAYLRDVEHELTLAGTDKSVFAALKATYDKMHDTSVVNNFQGMSETIQKVRDLYHDLMEHEVEVLSDKYLAVNDRLEKLTQKLSEYKREWNAALWKKAEDLQRKCEKLTGIHLDIPSDEVQDRKTGYALHDLANEAKMADDWFTQIDVWETEIHSENPVPPVPSSSQTPSTPSSSPTSSPTPQPPKTLHRKADLPKGKMHKADYKAWLLKQLAFVNKLSADTIIDFDE